MVEAVNKAMLELQGALLARSLYPSGHPRIRASEERALELLSEVLQERNEISLFAVEGRVIFDNDILPASTTLVDTFFHTLQLKGVDQITIRQGLDRQEMAEFLDRLADGDPKAWTLRTSAHMTFGSLKAVDRGAMKTRGPEKTSFKAFAEDAAEVLPGIWEDLAENMTLQAAVLGDIVSCISKAVTDSANALIPLAPLKRHDEYTFVHTINVAILSISLAEAVGFDSNATHELSVAALLHDVGKQGVPQEVLNKNGLFTAEERRLMEIHPVEGARILLNTSGVPDIASVVAYEHHIRADGGGYPKVPKGWKVNLASRIVQLADVFDALRTNRPYRPGLPLPRIVEVMKSESGSFFDADLLEVFFQEVVSCGIPDPV